MKKPMLNASYFTIKNTVVVLKFISLFYDISASFYLNNAPPRKIINRQVQFFTQKTCIVESC